jgi:hypothetical protein
LLTKDIVRAFLKNQIFSLTETRISAFQVIRISAFKATVARLPLFLTAEHSNGMKRLLPGQQQLSATAHTQAVIPLDLHPYIFINPNATTTSLTDFESPQNDYRLTAAHAVCCQDSVKTL